MRAPDRLVRLGVFGAPHGVRGEIRVKSFAGAPVAIGRYGALTDASRARAFMLSGVRAIKDDMVVARVDGVTTREAAAALTGVVLFAPRAALPPPGEDEFYVDDLVGLEAVTAAGAPFGTVIAVENYGAGDILEIAPADGGETRLLPFTRAVVPTLDFGASRIVVAPPDEVDGEER